MPTVILDTDFLSSFLKIERCHLIRAFYHVEQVLIPLAVHRELARTPLLSRLLNVQWIEVAEAEIPHDEALLQDTTFHSLGAGEQACMMLARTQPDSLLLMSDNKARQFARSLGIQVVNIPAFLLACKMNRLVNPEEMIAIIQDLNDKDYYKFKSSVRDLLLD